MISYFVVGALIKKFYKKESGMDVIPNKNFWIQLPFLVMVLFDHCCYNYIEVYFLVCRMDLFLHLVPATVSSEQRLDPDKATIRNSDVL